MTSEKVQLFKSGFENIMVHKYMIYLLRTFFMTISTVGIKFRIQNYLHPNILLLFILIRYILETFVSLKSSTNFINSILISRY